MQPRVEERGRKLKNRFLKNCPITRRLLEVDEVIKRLESQIISEEMKELKREGIKYYQPRDEA